MAKLNNFFPVEVFSARLRTPRTTAVLAAAACVAALAVAGCHRGPREGEVAVVNGHSIMRSDLDKLYNAQLAANPQQAPPSEEESESKRLGVLNQMITDEILEQRAAKLNLTATDAEVDAKLAEMKAPYSEEQFDAKLKASNLTLDELRHDLRRSLTQNKLLNKEINSKITITDADVAKYFNAHRAEYNLIQTEYRLAQIQVTGQPAPQSGNLQRSKATTPDEAQAKIKALKNRLDSGEDFGAIAMNFSERPDTAPNGGDMGFIAQSQLDQMKVTDPATYNAITALKVGQMTPILPLLDAQTHKVAGYAIYKLLDKQAAGQRDLGDPAVQQNIRQQLHDERSQLLKAAFFEDLHDHAKIENFLAEQIFRDDAK